LQQDRMTKVDREIIEQAESLHVGPKPPETQMYLGVNRELLSYKHKQAGRHTAAKGTDESPVSAA
jgi:hypothetical protein